MAILTHIQPHTTYRAAQGAKKNAFSDRSSLRWRRYSHYRAVTNLWATVLSFQLVMVIVLYFLYFLVSMIRSIIACHTWKVINNFLWAVFNQGSKIILVWFYSPCIWKKKSTEQLLGVVTISLNYVCPLLLIQWQLAGFRILYWMLVTIRKQETL